VLQEQQQLPRAAVRSSWAWCRVQCWLVPADEGERQAVWSRGVGSPRRVKVTLWCVLLHITDHCCAG
jgi:hypothetical protein